MRLLETEWDDYRRRVIPKNAGEVQVTESRRAFFSGAWAIYTLMMRHLSAGTDGETPADMEFMHKLDREMRDFAERVRRGEA